MINKEWVYRKICKWHCLINVTDNRLLEVSPKVALLFSEYQGDIESWREDLSFSEEDYEKILNSLILNNIFIYE